MILAANDRGELYEQGLTWHGMPEYPPARPGNAMTPAMSEEIDERWPKYIRRGMCPPEWWRPQ